MCLAIVWYPARIFNRLARGGKAKLATCEEGAEPELRAALRTQRQFRMHRCRHIVHEARVRKRAMEVAAVKVQAAWRARGASWFGIF